MLLIRCVMYKECSEENKNAAIGMLYEFDQLRWAEFVYTVYSQIYPLK